MIYNQTPVSLFKNDNLEIKKIYEKGKNFMLFTFRGKFSEKSCEEGYNKWKQINSRYPLDTFIHVWDCEQMTGFEQAAKKKWMVAMNEMYDQMEEVWLVADNILIRGAARLMSKFSKHELKAFKNTSEVESWFREQTPIEVHY